MYINIPYLFYISERKAWANSIDPDQMPQNAVSDWDLHNLPFIQRHYTHMKLEKRIYSNKYKYGKTLL